MHGLCVCKFLLTLKTAHHGFSSSDSKPYLSLLIKGKPLHSSGLETHWCGQGRVTTEGWQDSKLLGHDFDTLGSPCCFLVEKRSKHLAIKKTLPKCWLTWRHLKNVIWWFFIIYICIYIYIYCLQTSQPSIYIYDSWFFIPDFQMTSFAKPVLASLRPWSRDEENRALRRELRRSDGGFEARGNDRGFPCQILVFVGFWRK